MLFGIENCFEMEMLFGFWSKRLHLEFLKNWSSLMIAKDNLIRRKEEVEGLIRCAELRGMVAGETVNKWLRDVQDKEAELDAIFQHSLPQVGLGYNNCISAYKLGEQVYIMLQLVTELERESVFNAAIMFTLPPVVKLIDDAPNAIGIDKVMDQFWSYFNDNKNPVIGIHGMGGVGKSTLLKKINNMFCEDIRGYDIVIWIDLSSESTVEQIQNKIAERLGLFFPENATVRDRGGIISHSLMHIKFVLLFDDLRDELHSQLGIPLPSGQNECKIIFTSRMIDACGRMRAKIIRMRCLDYHDAYELFKETVTKNTLDSLDCSHLSHYHPSDMTLLCGGLPLSLVTVGKAMSSKTSCAQWNYQIKKLRKFAADFDGMKHNVFKPLIVSYNCLKTEELKKCFLYFALLLSQNPIEKSRVVHYWIAEGFFENIREWTDRLICGYSIIEDLIGCCLLMPGGNGSMVKMHESFRDMGSWIAAGCGMEEKRQNFFVATDDCIDEFPCNLDWLLIERISLTNTSIKSLSGFECRNLSTLILKKCTWNEIASDLFCHMSSL